MSLTADSSAVTVVSGSIGSIFLDLRWVGLRLDSQLMGLVGSGRVTENGPTNNSDITPPALAE